MKHTHTHTYIYIYIYIYCHPQTYCLVLSELLSMARHAGLSKPGSKPVQLYVRVSLRPLGQQTDHLLLWLVVFSSISTLVDYQISNPPYTYYTYIWFVNQYFIGNLFKMSQSSFLCTRLNGIKYSELILIILFSNNCICTQVNSIKYW